MKTNTIAKDQRRYELRTAKRHEKVIYKCYVELSKDIEDKLAKSLFDDVKEVIESKFKPRLQLTLEGIAKFNINQFVDYFVEKFKRTINFDELQAIKSKTLSKFLTKYTAKTVMNVTDTTIKILNDRISKLTREGYSQADIVNEIVRATKGEIGVNRAKIIARVETSKAFQITNYDTAVKAGLKYKTWWYIGGGMENRKYHQAMNGKKIPINQKFDVQGEGKVPATKMRFPKDPECRVAGQVINCTCQIIYT